MMDQNHVVSDQLPDESYIERLFPKCPPKQNSQANRRAPGSRETPRRQTRSKRRHRSRREVENRRVKNRSAFKDKEGDTSDSSGANVSSGKRYEYPLGSSPISSYVNKREPDRYLARSQSNHGNIRQISRPTDTPNRRNVPNMNESSKISGATTVVKSSSSYVVGEKKSSNNSRIKQETEPSPATKSKLVSNRVDKDDNNNKSEPLDNNNGASNGIRREASIGARLVDGEQTDCKNLNTTNNSIHDTITSNNNISDFNNGQNEKKKPSEDMNEPDGITDYESRKVYSSHVTDRTADFVFKSNKVDATKKKKHESTDLVCSNGNDMTRAQSKTEDNSLNLQIQDPLIPEHISDDEKYINLFVYDSHAGDCITDKSQTRDLSLGTDHHQQTGGYKNSINKNLSANIEQDLSSESLLNESSQPTETSGLENRKLENEEQDESIPDFDISSQQLTKIPSTDAVRNFESVNANCNINSIDQQTSQQLLVTDANENDPNVIRNDASVEELCTSNNNIGALIYNFQQHNRNSTNNPQNRESSTQRLSDIANHVSQRSDDTLSNPDKLQTVDQMKEDVRIHDTTNNSPDHLDGIMSTNRPSLACGSLTPPGFPQRIHLRTNENDGGLTGCTKESAKQETHIITKTNRSEGQRVKFDDKNLVSVKDDSTSSQQLNDKIPLAHMPSSRRELTSSMPIIKEAHDEVEYESNKNRQTDCNLSPGLSKLTLSENSHHDDLLQLSPRDEKTSMKPQDCLAISTLPDEYFEPSPDVGISQDATVKSREADVLQTPSLRHHKIPNESSHYSIVRAARDIVQEDRPDNIRPLYSSIQFNSISDVDSETEELATTTNLNLQKTGSSGSARSYTILKYETNPTIQPSEIRSSTSLPAPTIRPNEQSEPAQVRTSMVFPRLDEGLSSEPESCDDEVEDDDERAMDADVDADDDDDDDDDDDEADDDVEETLNSLDRRMIQTSMDDLVRQHQQQKKPQNRSTSTSQQHNLPLYGLQTNDNQLKVPSSAFSGYSTAQDLLDHNDLKTIPAYLNQDVQSNYWPDPANNQVGLSSQPSSCQQQYNNRRPSGVSTTSSYGNKDEVKTGNRLSSDTDNETDRLLGSQRNDQLKLANNDTNSNTTVDIQPVSSSMKQTTNSKEVLIEGVLFNVKYLGSTHSECEGRSEKEDRILQAEMAVKEVKFRNGDPHSAVEVQLFISTEKIMVLDDKHRKIMMDHSLRTISYIADIGDAIVLIVRKKSVSGDATNELGRPVPKISCHVFESSDSHTITKSISQAFQVAYAELVKANGTGDPVNYLPREIDYQEVLNSQEMSTDEIEMFARKENQREVIVPKNENEILGLSIVESGWGSVLPTVVIASLKPDGPAYRCKKLSIGDQILSVNGISLVGLPLSECQEILRKTKSQRVARLSVVPCPITVEVKIKRPDTKYQLGFSVQNGVICSLLRGGIAERGGVRVGHRIMSINGTTVVGVPHEKIVTLLASSVGEIRMKTCLTSLYRHMLGEENPVHI